jgi:hypothetical protein
MKFLDLDVFGILDFIALLYISPSSNAIDRVIVLSNIDESQIKHIRGHSMLPGATQDLVLKGASLCQIMIKGGWTKTDTVTRYVERVDQHSYAH